MTVGLYTIAHRVHHFAGSSQSLIEFWFGVNHAAKVGKRLRDFHILTTHRHTLNGCTRVAAWTSVLNHGTRIKRLRLLVQCLEFLR